MRKLWLRAWCGIISALSTGVTFAADEVYAAPKAEDVRGRILVWAAEQPGVDPAKKDALQQLWTWDGDAPAADELLDRVVDSFALFHESVARMVQESRTSARFAVSADVLQSPNPFVKANLGLFAGRQFVERRMYDEADEILKTVEAREVVDPASLFFHRAVAAQGLLEIKPALDSLDQLLKQTENVPLRYSTTAVLMQTELLGLQEKSLAEVARLMSDSERRLELGRAGEKVQGVQERIIDNLDELIKKMEAQGGGGGGGGGSAKNNSNESSSPAGDSSVKGQTAPGNTDPKKLSKDGIWGNLPDKDHQAKAKNEIFRNFPSHYRHAIDAYSRKLANRAATKK